MATDNATRLATLERINEAIAQLGCVLEWQSNRALDTEDATHYSVVMLVPDELVVTWAKARIAP